MSGWIIPEWLLAVALTFFVADILTDAEWPAWFGVLSVAGWLTWRLDAPLEWSILAFVLAALAAGGVWYWVFRAFIGRGVRRVLQKDAPVEALVAIKGAKGVLRRIEGRVFFRWNGDELWPVANPPENAADGAEAVAEGLKDGAVVLK